MGFERMLPYNDLPDLPLLVNIETSSILKMAMAELRVSGHLIPNQSILI